MARRYEIGDKSRDVINILDELKKTYKGFNRVGLDIIPAVGYRNYYKPPDQGYIFYTNSKYMYFVMNDIKYFKMKHIIAKIETTYKYGNSLNDL